MAILCTPEDDVFIYEPAHNPCLSKVGYFLACRSCSGQCFHESVSSTLLAPDKPKASTILFNPRAKLKRTTDKGVMTFSNEASLKPWGAVDLISLRIHKQSSVVLLGGGSPDLPSGTLLPSTTVVRSDFCTNCRQVACGISLLSRQTPPEPFASPAQMLDLLPILLAQKTCTYPEVLHVGEAHVTIEWWPDRQELVFLYNLWTEYGVKHVSGLCLSASNTRCKLCLVSNCVHHRMRQALLSA